MIYKMQPEDRAHGT